MVIFGAVAMLMLVIAGAVAIFSTDLGKGDPSDAALYTWTAILGLGTTIAWSALNVALVATRAQTGGQYVAGIRMQRDDGSAPTVRNALAWWFSLNPLLFSWPMAPLLGLAAAPSLSLLLQRWSFIPSIGLGVLCITMPIVSAGAALLDSRNRTLSDRVAGIAAVTE